MSKFLIPERIGCTFIPVETVGKSVYVVAPLTKHYLGQHDQRTHGNWSHGDVNDFADTKLFKETVAEYGQLGDSAFKNYFYREEFYSSDLGKEFIKTVQELYPSAQWDDTSNSFKSSFANGYDSPDNMPYIAYEAMKERLKNEVFKATKFAQYEDSAENYVPYIEELQRHGKVCVAIDTSSFVNLVNGDEFRLMTQFETAKSNGFYNPALRRAGEMAAQSIPLELKDSERPVYGYVSPSDFPDEITSSAVEQYGDVRIVLKESTKKRTTMTIGDSLNTFSMPLSMTQTPTSTDVWRAVDWKTGVMSSFVDGDSPSEVNDYGHYFEAQIHGQVKASDIEKIYIPDSLDTPAFRAKIPKGIEVDTWEPNW